MQHLFVQPHSLTDDDLIYLDHRTIPVGLGIDFVNSAGTLPSNIAEIDVYLKLSPNPGAKPSAHVVATIVTVTSVCSMSSDYQVACGSIHQLMLSAFVRRFDVNIEDPDNIDIGFDFDLTNKLEVEDIIRQLVADYTSEL